MKAAYVPGIFLVSEAKIAKSPVEAEVSTERNGRFNRVSARSLGTTLLQMFDVIIFGSLIKSRLEVPFVLPDRSSGNCTSSIDTQIGKLSSVTRAHTSQCPSQSMCS